MTTTTDLFTCEGCGGTFRKGWSDGAALAEAVQVFGAVPEDPALVCDDCWAGMQAAGLIPLDAGR